MTTATASIQTPVDPHHLGRAGGGGDETPGSGAGGPAPKKIVVAYGFWIFLLSDIIMFAALFAAYAVLKNATAGGPITNELFSRTTVAIETVLLLLSTFACGLAAKAAEAGKRRLAQIGLLVTATLGVAFLVLEIIEFAELIGKGAGPDRSAFLSAFFALVGCHGLHVAVGLLWAGTMIAQFKAKGFRADIMRRFACFNLFWHALDIIWVAIFTVVYLLGTLP
ncbi:cytochrome (ubi)quinol oxidase subunit III [Novosphingobium sp. AP12]|uniref:cytochrome (ubi)quinol oxidase subunit III n=1 Tax=Novosphingobium sp. AP12 TaxID=1144305 RepID=UPI000271D96A|nr:cytochrome (ubi)quinol oxidase subunit III [Novosphingobium sp. AP12]EJL20399.1 heme/copper-type cytochrome/quinol oxidase, subunit 3 [Novosphingobium sp. AP12]